MSETLQAASLLALDPDLGQLLSPERQSAAEREVRVGVASLTPGAWDPDAWCRRDPGSIGVLIVRGIVMREICVHQTPSAELLGPGDILRAPKIDAQTDLLPAPSRWSVIGAGAMAVLDGRCALGLLRYPEINAVVLDRFSARAERLAVTQAISQITGVDTRVEALLWHLASRWGRVAPGGVIVPVALSHRLLASLVGARRPTVSTALARLADRDRVTRRPDGAWVLTGTQPPADLLAGSDPYAPDHLGCPSAVEALAA